MDYRKPLTEGTLLPFPGMPCHIDSEIGRGSNALVYRAWYADAYRPDLRHHVLVKELFPYDAAGGVLREEESGLLVMEEAKELFELNRISFESANEIHLRILEKRPDGVGANLNTFPLRNTLYSVLGFDGGTALNCFRRRELSECINMAEELLEAADVFHQSGFLHLDISPDNILITGQGRHRRLTLIDFNSVHPLNAGDGTRPLYCSYKEGFTAPEIGWGKGAKACVASDLYSVGGVFYWLLCGKLLHGEADKHVCDGLDVLVSVPESVKAMVRHILIKSRFPLASKRYQSAEEMLQDLQELRDRLDGVGVTHWALWESGRRSAEHYLRQNRGLSYLNRPEDMYPVRVLQADGNTLTSPQEVLSIGKNALLTGNGGGGKTSFLLHCVHSAPSRYSASQTALFYIALHPWAEGDGYFLRNRLLETLKFTAETRGVEDARHQLELLLDTPIEANGREKPAYCLLLDGLNEVRGNSQALLDEIRLLSEKRGVQILLTSRSQAEELSFEKLELCPLENSDIEVVLRKNSLLIPEDQELLSSLRTPLMLSLYIRTALSSEKQVLFRSADQLIDAYLESLFQKEAEKEGEQSPLRWQCDAAIHYVLPMLALAMSQEDKTFGNEKCLSVVQECFKSLHSGWMCKAFPQWIGRRNQLFFGCNSSESWMGRLVVDLLWQRLGLLVRDETENWRISHQVLAEVLAQKGAAIRKRCCIRRCTGWMLGGCALLLAVFLGFSQLAWARRPYDDLLAGKTMEYASSCMMNISRLIEEGRNFLQSPSLTSRCYFESNLASEQSNQENSLGNISLGLSCLEQTLASGTRLSSTGLSINGDAFREATDLAITLRKRQQELLSKIGEDGSMSEDFRKGWENYLDEAEKQAQRLYEELLKCHYDVWKKKSPKKYEEIQFVVDAYEATQNSTDDAMLRLYGTDEYGEELLQELLSGE